MREDKFYELMGEIDPEIIAAADKPVPFRQKRGFKIMLIAAVLALVMLITPVAGAFALAVGYIATRDDINDSGEPQDPTQGDTQQDVKPGGLVGELFGGIDWGGLKDAIGKDGNVNWGAIFDVLQGKNDSEPESTNVAYSLALLDDGTYKLEKFTGFSNKYILSIPEELNGGKITVIGEGALAYNEDVNHITVPDSVTVIEPGAFASCPNLVSVEMSDNVQKIGVGAFENCTSLIEIDLPNSLLVLAESAFANCENLQLISLPEGLQEIGRDAFANTAISSITIPSTLTDIYDIDFKGCMELEEVIFTGDAPTVHKEPSSDKSAPDNKNAPDYTVYYMLNSQGFSKPEWHGYTSRLMAYNTEQFVLDHLDIYRYSEVRMYNAEVLGHLNLSGVDEVTVLDTYGEYEAFSHVLTSERYDRNYFKQFAIVLIQVKHSSSEQVLGLAGIGGQLYTTGGVYYLGLYPIVKIDAPDSGATDDDIAITYLIAEVQRSDIRTDDVVRVGEVYTYEIDSQGASKYHKGFLDYDGKDYVGK